LVSEIGHRAMDFAALSAGAAALASHATATVTGVVAWTAQFGHALPSLATAPEASDVRAGLALSAGLLSVALVASQVRHRGQPA